MKAVLFLLVCLVVAAFAAPLSVSQQEHLFAKFVEQYNKQYEVREFFKKFETFKSNLDLILAHNAKDASYKMAVNKFADLSVEEFGKLMGLRTQQANNAVNAEMHQVTAASIDAVNPVDWRTKNVVAPVKDQGQCGSCWAFSTVASLESRRAIVKGSLEQYSEQFLVDCSGSTGNEGCNGGLMTSAFDFIIQNGGACKETDYPYTAMDGECQKCTPAVQVASYKMVPTTDVGHADALTSGPISIAVAASSAAFQFYSSGVLTSCSDTQLDHGVALVGFTKDTKLGNVFILRNSWGPSWGEQGYMRIVFGACALGVQAVDCYPVIQ